MDVDRTWWKEAVVYQVYPRSFKDSNGDGIGDIQGIIQKVDYLEWLGVDVVWLNPVYSSPNADNGYDISDYRAIMDEFGTMDDWEELLSELHDRDMRLIMDLVVNHTSDEHEWFRESRSSRDSEYRDYYIWREGTDGGPPNNWESLFGGPAWTYDERTDEYYLHLFDEKQPDLNWRNPAVREEVYDMMRWWLEKGIDGFRMDVINLISKPEDLLNGDPESPFSGSEQCIDGPKVHDYLREMRERVLSDYDVMTVGETVGTTVEEGRRYVEEDGLSMIIHFDHMEVDFGDDGRWSVPDLTLGDLKDVITTWQTTMHPDGWSCLYLSNHDQPRQVSRFGDDGEYRVESAKMLATALHTLRGTPFVYQGEEIGMTNVDFEDLSDLRDVSSINYAERQLAKERYGSFAEMAEVLRHRSRDNARTPMQWTDGPNAGFTAGDPWIKVNDNYTEINVERAREDERSVLHYYRRLIDLREEHPVVIYGRYEPLVPDHPEILAYRRELGSEQLLVVLNFFGDRPTFEPPADLRDEAAELVISNYDVEMPTSIAPTKLRPYEARVYRIPADDA